MSYIKTGRNLLRDGPFQEKWLPPHVKLAWRAYSKSKAPTETGNQTIECRLFSVLAWGDRVRYPVIHRWSSCHTQLLAWHRLLKKKKRKKSTILFLKKKKIQKFGVIPKEGQERPLDIRDLLAWRGLDGPAVTLRCICRPSRTNRRKLKIILDQKALVPNFVTLTAYCLEKVLWTGQNKNSIFSFRLFLSICPSKSCLTSFIYRTALWKI